MQTCAYCFHNLSDNAVYCDQCGRPVNPETPLPVMPRLKWFFRPTSLVAMFLLMGPLMLPAVWFHPKFSSAKKLVVTAIVAVLTVVLSALAVSVIKSIGSYYNQVSQMLGTT